MKQLIPVEIEITNSKFKKNVGWSVVGESDIDLIDNSLGDIINLAVQFSAKKNFYYTVKFSDGTQKVVECNVEKLPLELIIWSWRIKERKTEKDYVTFGIDFSQLERNMIVYNSQVNKKLGLHIKSINRLSESEQVAQLKRIGLMKFLKSEIFRYFFEQKKDMVLPDEIFEGLKIPSKANERLNAFLGLGVLIFIFGGCVAGMNSLEPASNSRSRIDPNDPEYIESVIDRSGVGRTIDSAQEVVDACKVMMRDKGMSKSQANRRCS